MSSFLRGSKLIDDCTSSIAYDKKIQAASAAFDPQCYEIIDDTGQVLFIPNIMDLTDSTLVDILAWQFHVDFYDPTWDLELRKQLVQLSIVWHMTKGTVALVEAVIEMFYPGTAYLQEWFTYHIPFPPNYPVDGWHDRYRFRIVLNDTVVDPDVEAAMLALIDRYKPVTRWCEGILRSLLSSTACFVCGVASQRITVASGPPPIR